LYEEKFGLIYQGIEPLFYHLSFVATLGAALTIQKKLPIFRCSVYSGFQTSEVQF
jgi:hypothetical protein